jgi:lipopolysaccharide exporter
LKKYLSSYWIRSAFFTFLQRFTLTFFGFVNFVILIRGLTKPQMGVWAFFLVVTTLFETTKTNLLKNAHVKFVAGDGGSAKTAIASSSLILNATISLLFIGFLFLFSGVLSNWLKTGKELEDMLKWFIPGMIALVFFSHLEAVSLSHFDFKSVFAGNFSRQVVFFAIIISHQIFKIPFSIVHLAIYQSISIAFGLIVLYLFSKKHLLHRFNPSWEWTRKILGFGGYIFGIGILSNIFANVDQIMIARFTSSKSLVASYNAATRITALIEIPSYAAAEILLPKVSQVSVTDGLARVKYIYERMVGILLCFTTPLALFIILFPNFVIGIIAGAQYADSAFILQMYMISGIIKPIQNQAANILLYIGKSRLCFILNVFYLLLNFLMNYICFKSFGPYGAAIGNVITCVSGTLAWYYILHKIVGAEISQIAKHVLETYKTIFAKATMTFVKIKQVRFN